MTSSLLAGKVRHRRATPTVYALEHDVWYLDLDLDDMDAAFAATPLLRRNKRWPLSFRDRDYLPNAAQDVSGDVRRHLAQSGVVPARIGMITTPRVLGYQFNPATFYICRDAADTINAVVVEVHNTFGERHLYTLSPERPSGPFSAQMDKEFYVSPFIEESGTYRVTVSDHADRVAIGISLRIEGRHLLATSLDLRRLPLTTRNLGWLALRYPFVTHKTTLAIHWHALRLWLRRVRWHRHQPVTPAATPRAHGAHGTAR